MESYAINEVPLAGHAILFGRGLSEQSFDAMAVPSLRVNGRPDASIMSMAESTDGTIAVTGNGESDMQMSESAYCYLLIYGRTEAAVMVLCGLADGRVIPVARGVSEMGLTGEADGTIALLGSGTSMMQLANEASGVIAKQGSGHSEMVMIGRAGIPRPIKIPDAFTDAHPTRQLRVPHASTTRQVETEARSLAIEAENRTIIAEMDREE